MKKNNWFKIVIGLLLVGTLIALRMSGVFHEISLSFFQEHAVAFHQFITHNYLFGFILFSLSYTVVVATGLPLTPILNIAAGYFFALFGGALCAIIGATLGTSISLLIVRYLLRDSLHAKYGHRLDKFDKKFEEHGALYLLFLFLLPLSPYGVISIIAGISSVSLLTFIWTAAIGTIPTALIYAYAGRQLMHIKLPSDILSPSIVGALLLLALFSLLPIIIDRIRSYLR
ncbi:MAG: VTT domain-containing protein [Candidatus Babeliales bacterium]